ncbi:MAG: cytochrome c maturation protein CcmE [Gammaproteobacteria bacterium]
MHPVRKRRLFMIGGLVLGVSIAVALMLMALGENLNVFYSPSQVMAREVPADHTFRVGGMVEEGSVQHDKKTLDVTFAVTDTVNTTKVKYTGILPDLFREGQGIIAQGKLDQNGVFIADMVLAKHDENYMPPEVSEALEAAQDMQKYKQNQ